MKKALIIIAGCISFILAVVAIAGYILLVPGKSTRPANPLVTGVSYIGMSVSDVEKTAYLYGTAANMVNIAPEINGEELQLLLPPGAKGEQNPLMKTTLLRSVNAQLLLMEFASPVAQNITPVNGPGIAHICFQVNQDTQTYQKFLANGSTPIGASELQQVNPKNPVYYGYIEDSDGVLIEIEHVDVPALQLETPPKNDYRIRQISLSTPDMQRLIDFYSVLLEEDNPRRIGRLRNLSGEKVDAITGLPGSEIEMAWFQTRNLELELIQYHSHKTPDLSPVKPLQTIGYNAIVFDVEDIHRVAKMLDDLRASITLAPKEIAGGWIMYARDPDNNLLGFQQLDEQSPLSAEQFDGNGI